MATTTSAPKSTRKPVIPPKRITATMSVFEYLAKCQPPLDQKIIDIACSQSSVPPGLHDEAAQEIRMMWMQMKPDTEKFQPGQIAAYAHRMAGHAALRLRRELGASVRLPGSAFRKRKDGSSYVTAGVLAAALDWSDLENWFNAEDQPDASMTMGGLNADSAAATLTADEELVSDEDSEAAQRAARLDAIRASADVLTERQRSIVIALIEGATYEEVMAEHGIKKGILMREITIVGSALADLGL